MMSTSDDHFIYLRNDRYLSTTEVWGKRLLRTKDVNDD